MWADQNFTGSHVWDNGEHRAGCSKRLPSKAAGERGRLRLRSRLSEDLTFFISALASALTFP